MFCLQTVGVYQGAACTTWSGMMLEEYRPQKPHVCNIGNCRKRFSHSFILYRHQREKHGTAHIRPDRAKRRTITSAMQSSGNSTATGNSVDIDGLSREMGLPTGVFGERVSAANVVGSPETAHGKAIGMSYT